MSPYERNFIVLVAGVLALAGGLVLAAVVVQPIGYAAALIGLVVTMAFALRFTT